MIVGLNVHVPRKNLRQYIYELGCKHVRMDIVPFYTMEEQVAIIREFHEHGVSVLACISCELDPDHHNLREIIQAANDVSYINEANNPKYFNDARLDYNLYIEDFLEFLFDTDSNDWIPVADFVTGEFMHDKGLHEWLSAGHVNGRTLAHHVYGSSARKVRKRLKTWCPFEVSLDRELKRAGVRPKEIWLTETGLATDKHSWNDQKEFYKEMLKKPPKGVNRIYFYELMDDRSARPYGIINPDHIRKPAFYVLQDYFKGRL